MLRYFIPEKDLEFVRQYINQYENSKTIFDDKTRYCNGLTDPFEPFWSNENINRRNPKVFSLSWNEQQKTGNPPVFNYNRYVLGFPDETLIEKRLLNYKSQIVRDDAVSNKRSAQLKDEIDSLENVKPVVNSLINGVYFCVETIDNKSRVNQMQDYNIVGIFQINVESIFQKLQLKPELPEKLSIEEIYDKS